ncbi:MAG: ABC transporter ATP-binding protein [Syntrophales bacterium]
MRTRPPIVAVEGLQVVKGRNLILDVPFLEIEQGEIFSLIGPNGAGKTTLLQALSFLSKPSRGKVCFGGKPIGNGFPVLEYRRKLSMVFQEPLLFNTTVFENVASGLKIRGVNRAQIRNVVSRQLERFGVAHLEQRSARTLSGGEAQRTSLARAFAVHPEILFLDEPFASLDPPARESLIQDLEGVLRETQTTAVLATHDRMEALRLSDRIAVMERGKIAQIGPPAEVMNHPADEFIASFVGTETILTGSAVGGNAGTFTTSVSGRLIEAAGGALPGEQVILCIRPENVTLSANPVPEPSSARNVFSATVERIIPAGFFHKVRLDCGFPLVAYVTNHALEDLRLEPGKNVFASFKATAIHVIRKKPLSS